RPLRRRAVRAARSRGAAVSPRQGHVRRPRWRDGPLPPVRGLRRRPDAPHPHRGADPMTVPTADEIAFAGAIPADLYIDGRWRPASSGLRFDVLDPSTEKVLTRVADA